MSRKANWLAKRIGPALALAAACMLPAGQAVASPYDVAGVVVAADADNAVEAKARAIAQGQEAALGIVLQRLTRAADQERLPQTTEGEIDTLVANFTVQQEQTTATHYGATLTFAFDPQAVRALLARGGLAFTDTQAAPSLMVALFRQDGVLLEDDKNANAQAWRAYDLDNTLTPLKLPDRSLSEQGIDPEALLAGDADAQSALRFYHGVDAVLVSLCEAGGPGGQLTCTLQGNGPVGPVSLSESFAGDSDPLAAAQAAAGSFLARFEEQWKERNAIHHLSGARTGAPVPVVVSFSGLAEWQALRARLAGVPGMTDIDIKALNARGALLDLYYNGPAEDLALMVAQQGMQLTKEGERWVLRQ